MMPDPMQMPPMQMMPMQMPQFAPMKPMQQRPNNMGTQGLALLNQIRQRGTAPTPGGGAAPAAGGAATGGAGGGVSALINAVLNRQNAPVNPGTPPPEGSQAYVPNGQGPVPLPPQQQQAGQQGQQSQQMGMLSKLLLQMMGGDPRAAPPAAPGAPLDLAGQ